MIAMARIRFGSVLNSEQVFRMKLYVSITRKWPIFMKAPDLFHLSQTFDAKQVTWMRKVMLMRLWKGRKWD